MTNKQAINPYIVGSCFLDFCMDNGWIEKEGEGKKTKYFITEDGIDELKKFGISDKRLYI